MFEDPTVRDFLLALGAMLGVILCMLLFIGGMELVVNWGGHRTNRRLRKMAKQKAAEDAALTANNQPLCTCKHWFNVHRRTAPHACANPSCHCQGYLGPDPIISGMWTATDKTEKLKP